MKIKLSPALKKLNGSCIELSFTVVQHVSFTAIIDVIKDSILTQWCSTLKITKITPIVVDKLCIILIFLPKRKNIRFPKDNSIKITLQETTVMSHLLGQRFITESA